MSMNILHIPFMGTITEFNLGPSEEAKKVVVNYNDYLENRKYDSLNTCFSNLHRAVKLTPTDDQWNMNLCMACDALATSVFLNNLNVFQRLAVGNSVTSIIYKSGLMVNLRDIYKSWEDRIKNTISDEMKSISLDFEATQAAGLAIVTPSPE